MSMGSGSPHLRATVGQRWWGTKGPKPTLPREVTRQVALGQEHAVVSTAVRLSSALLELKVQGGAWRAALSSGGLLARWKWGGSRAMAKALSAPELPADHLC